MGVFQVILGGVFVNLLIERVLTKIKQLGPSILHTFSDEDYIMYNEGKVARAPRYIYERYKFYLNDNNELTKKTALTKIKLMIKQALTDSPDNGILWEDIKAFLEGISEDKLELLNREIERQLN